MSTRWSEALRALPGALTGLLMGVLCMPGQADARLLFLDSPLRSLTPLARERSRIGLGSEYFGASGWTGLRNTLRYDGAHGKALVWTIGVPWCYSSYFDRGETGGGDIRAGLAAYHPSLQRGALGVAGEIWLPFSRDRLYPLEQRRAFARASLLAARRGVGLSWRAVLSYRWELQGVGPESTGGRWPRRFDADLRGFRRFNPLWGLFLEGGLSVSPEAASWTHAGAGLRFEWAAGVWSAELAGEGAWGAHGDRDLYDYRLVLSLSREFLKADTKEAGESEEAGEDAGEGELPPPTGPGETPGDEGKESGDRSPGGSAAPGSGR